MLHISLLELSGAVEQDLLSNQLRFAKQQRQAVLKLVSETKGSSRLVEGRSSPDPAFII